MRQRPTRAWWAGADTVLGVAVRRLLVESAGTDCVVTADVADASSRAAEGELVLVALDGRGGVAQRRHATEWVKRRPGVAHVAVAAAADDGATLSLLADGWAGVVLATASPHDAGEALRRIAVGERAVAAPGLGPVGADRLRDLDRCWPGMDHGLSRRESQVLVGLADGLSTVDIAARLVLGRETIRTHLRTLYRALGVRDRSAAVAEGFRRGILG